MLVDHLFSDKFCKFVVALNFCGCATRIGIRKAVTVDASDHGVVGLVEIPNNESQIIYPVK